MPLRFTIRVIGGRTPLPGVRISREVGKNWELVGITDPDGAQRWEVDPRILPLKLLFEPASQFWPKTVRFAEAEGEAEVHLDPLPQQGPRGWWHECLGPSAGGTSAGAGIRIGVLDTGLGPCICLRQAVATGAWVDGNYAPGPEACRDIASHGTHVAGIVGARPCREGNYVGVAPAVTVVAARVFSEETGCADHDDVANAIEALCRDHRVHILNLSLGGGGPYPTEYEAILRALDMGALVVAASGNVNGNVEFPAAYEEVIAVSAVGKLHEGSELARDGAHLTTAEPPHVPTGLYAAEFSCHGPEVICTAPGVDIISTVPSMSEDTCEYAAMTGTSMAAPITCGALAILLAEDEEYLSLAPTRERTDYAHQVLLRSCRNLGFSSGRQGAGLPTVP